MITSCKFKLRFTNNTVYDGIVDIEMAVPLKYLSNFWSTLKMPLIYCEINLMLNCVIFEVDKATTFAITDTKLYAPVVTLLTEDNTKLLQQLKSGFKHSINCNKYQSKVSAQSQNQYLD